MIIPVIAAILITGFGLYVYRSVASVPEMFKLNGELQAQGYYMAHIESVVLVNHAPSWWGQDKDSKHNAIFIIPPATVDKIFDKVGAIKPEYEKVDHYGWVVFWSAPIKTFSRTRWSKVVSSSVYDYKERWKQIK